MLRFLVPIAFLLAGTLAHADTLTLYALNPLKPINWKNPRMLSISTIHSVVTKAIFGGTHVVGHASVRVQCSADRYGGPYDFRGAMTTAPGVDEETLLKRDQIGLAVLFLKEDGRLESYPEIQWTLDQHMKDNRVRFITFELNHQDCLRLLEYNAEFKERKLDQWYGYPSEPLKGQGSACTSYAYSFLDVAGVMTPDMRQSWYKTVQVPTRLIGAPIYKQQKVSIEQLVHDPAPGWAQSNEPSIPFDVKDVGWLYTWIDNVWKNGGQSNSYLFTPVQDQEAKGLYVDLRNKLPERGPIWQK